MLILNFNFIKKIFNNKVTPDNKYIYNLEYVNGDNNNLDYCTICDLLHINKSFTIHCNLCNKCHIRNYIHCKCCNNCYDVYKENDIVKHRKLCKVLNPKLNCY